jgi:hypothetical protein
MSADSRLRKIIFDPPGRETANPRREKGPRPLLFCPHLSGRFIVTRACGPCMGAGQTKRADLRESHARAGGPCHGKVASKPGVAKTKGTKTKGTGTFFAAIFFISLLCFSPHFAIAGVKLPLEGYTRSGRFFPVVVDGADASRAISFSAQGCLDSQLDPGAGGNRIVPMLATGAARELSWVGGSIALRNPGDNERLIACSSAELNETLFPHDRSILIPLDTADLLPGPAVAWESLDAVLLDSPMFQRISDAQRSSLLAGGVTLAARGEIPDHRWPWRSNGSLWVLSATPAGPNGELIDEDVYAPTYAWTPGWSPQIRGQIMGVAALLVFFTAGILMFPKNRITLGSVIGLSLVAAGAVAGWHHSLGNIDRAGGDILVANEGLIQRDSWVYQRAKTSSVETVPWTGSTHPIFASAAGMRQANMRVHIAGNGNMSFVYQATAGHTIAFIRSDIQPGPNPETVGTHESPMEQAARAVYLSPGLRVVGEVPESNGRWPGVLIAH